MTADPAMRRAWRNVAVLLLAQAVMGAQMSMIFIVGGLTGQMLSPNPCIATLPLSMIVLGSALSARPLAGFMRRHGRQRGFVLACVMGALGAAGAALDHRLQVDQALDEIAAVLETHLDVAALARLAGLGELRS